MPLPDGSDDDYGPTLTDLEHRLQISRSTVRRLLRRAGIEPVRIGLVAHLPTQDDFDRAVATYLHRDWPARQTAVDGMRKIGHDVAEHVHDVADSERRVRALRN